MRVDPERDLTPDRWVVIQIDGKDTQYKRVLAGWHGNYVSGSSYRRSTPIVEEIEEEHNIIFKTKSGSTYICRRNAEGLTTASCGIYESLKLAGDEWGFKVKLLVYGDPT